MNLAKIFLAGRFTADPEIRYSQPNGTAIATGTIAVNRPSNKDKADFIPIVAFDKKAELLSKYFHKGSNVLVIGRLENNPYENKDGINVPYWQVFVEEIHFVDKKSASDADIPSMDTVPPIM